MGNKIKTIIEKLKGLLNPNKRLPEPQSKVVQQIETETSGKKEHMEHLKLTNVQDLAVEALKEKGVDENLLNGEIGKKLWEYLSEKNGPLEQWILKDDAQKIPECISKFLDGVEVDKYSGVISVKESKEDGDRKWMKEAIFNGNNQTIISREAEAYLSGKTIANGVQYNSITKTMHMDDKQHFDTIVIEENHRYEENKRAGDLYIKPSKDPIFADQLVGNLKSTVTIKDGQASYIDEAGNTKVVQLPERMTDSQKYTHTIYSVYDIQTANVSPSKIDTLLQEQQEKANSEQEIENLDQGHEIDD